MQDQNIALEDIGLGVIGLGGFGMFALQQFLQVPGVKLRLVGGTTRDESKRAAERYGARVGSVEELLNHPEIQLIYINTPPFLHAQQAEAAILAGKHVLVEKPLAIDLADGQRLLPMASDRNLILTTNLMQRYNPLVEKIGQLIDEQLLGQPLLMNLANHAVDEGLPPEHWFWDAEKSGGIFVEHGVHFFDLARHWFGDGEVVSGGRRARSDGCEDQVWCDVRFGGPIARFYHGFNQSSRTEHQAWELVFERGRIEMTGWIPLELQITAILDEPQTHRLEQILPGARLDVLANYGAAERITRGHGKLHEVYQKVRVFWSVHRDKQVIYCELLRRIMGDQIDSIRSSTHRRVVAAEDGLESLRYAIAARNLSQE